MAKYLGEVEFDVKNTKFKDYTPFDWAMYFLERHGQADGSHHKAWVLDQIARIYHGSQPTIKEASWDNGEREWRISLPDEGTKEYKDWVREMKDPDEEGQYQYDYDDGTAP